MISKNQVKSYTNTENSSPISLVNINVKTHNKMFANWIQQYKMIKHDDKMRCISGCKWWFNIHKSLWYTTPKTWKIKSRTHFNRFRKSFWQNFDIHLWEILYKYIEGACLKIIKGIYDKPRLTSYSVMKSC